MLIFPYSVNAVLYHLPIATVAVIAQVTPPSDINAMGGFAQEFSRSRLLRVATAYGTMQAQVGSSLNSLQWAVGITQLTWNAYLWFGAAKVAGDLDTWQAYAVIAIPVVVAGIVTGLPFVDVGLTI